MYKEHQIIMLSTNKAENCLVLSNNKLWMFNGYFTQDYLQSQNKKSYHLYIVSDETINKNDWCIDTRMISLKTNCPILFQAKPDQDGDFNEANKNIKKVIATTDSSLKVSIKGITTPEDVYVSTHDRILPQILQSFIEHYIQQYNNGNVIDKVLVEYEYIPGGRRIINFENPKPYEDGYGPQLLVNSNNEITIKLNKTSWNRDEVIILLNKFGSHVYSEYTKNLTMADFTDEWISKNL